MLFRRPRSSSGLAAFAAVASLQLVCASNNSPPTLSINSPSFTSKWIEGSNYVQVVEMSIKNTHTQNHLTLADALNVTLTSTGVNLVQPGTLVRLAPGDSAVVQLGVQPKAGFKSGTTCSGTVTATWGVPYGKTTTTTASVTGPCGIPQYTASASSLNFHWNPDWYNEVKYGIFIHWGMYAAPAYGNTGANEQYAEWYWNSMHDPTSKTQTYQYHKATYGTTFNYDDFISNFTAANFDAQNWVQLIADAGAQYMVPVTKHHDGWALFNFSTSISQRSFVQAGPKRDFIGELLTAAKTYQPQIRRGTYFSLPEWYNPAYAKYANGAFTGGPPTNPYTNATIPYMGYVPVNDFVVDIQAPQMNALAYDYDTEILWCDIGGANNSTIVMSEWINWAYTQGRQVTFNNRCGLSGDFTTPEYTTNGNIVSKKWESNRGMDPFSFGYNYPTPDSGYLTPNNIVQSLIDIVSKNGNFLLDIGPEHDGTIKAIMQNNLRTAGAWIKAHGESIFKTRFYGRTPGTGNFRYTQSPTAFYIHYLTSPPATLAIPDPVPYLPGDVVTIVGGSMNGTVIPTTGGYGNLGLTLGSAIRASDQFVWTFKISWKSTS